MESQRRSEIHVELRPIEISDSAPMWILTRDEDVRSFLGSPRTVDQLEGSLREQVGRFREVGWGLCAIISVESRDFLGYTGFIPCKVEGCDGPELVCAVHQPFRRLGVATTACQQAIVLGFSNFAWPRIYACVAQANTNVVGLVEHLGMQLLKERPHIIDEVQRIYSIQRP